MQEAKAAQAGGSLEGGAGRAIESPFLTDTGLPVELPEAEASGLPDWYELESPFAMESISIVPETGTPETDLLEVSAGFTPEEEAYLELLEDAAFAEREEKEALEAIEFYPTFRKEAADFEAIEEEGDLESTGENWPEAEALETWLGSAVVSEAALGEAFAAIEAGAQEAAATAPESWEETEAPPAAPRPAGFSPLAIPAQKQWDARDRPAQWIGLVYGLVVHTTGGGLPSKARKQKVYHTVAAVDHYTSSYGCHYVNGWKGAAGGDLLQVANEREQARGVGMTNKADPSKDQTLSIQRGRFEQDLPPILVTLWRKRWPNYRHPLELLPGTRSANVCYVHMECVPCVYHHAGNLVTDDQPLRPGLRFTQAQHDTVAQLAADIARRNSWPQTETWWRTPRLLGHEDLAPIARHDSRGGWDPGYLREKPYFDWEYVYGVIESILRAAPGAPLLPAPADGDGGGIFAPLGALLDRFRSLLSSGQEVLAVRLAYQRGVRDFNKLTNMVFFARHPEVGERKIQPHEKGLAQEWVKIRDTIVKPALKLLTR